MVVSNSTLDILNASKDLDVEYNLKLIILCLYVIYSVVLLYISFKWDAEELWQKMAKLFVMQIPSIIYLVFLPLSSFYLLREVSWEVVYTLLIAHYLYLFTAFLVLGQLGLFTSLGNWLGIETKVKKMEIKTND